MSSFGEILRRERELRQITLREISEATKINLRYLEGIERNDFRDLPGGVFNKGFIRAYAEYIGVDAEAMVTAYLDEESRQRLHDEERQRENLRRSEALHGIPAGGGLEDAPPTGARRRRRRLVVVIALSMLLVLLSGSILGAVKLIRRAMQTEIEVAVVLDRETSGLLRCDDGAFQTLDGKPAGAEFLLRCRTFLSVDLQDAGAVRLGVNGSAIKPAGPDGERLRGRRLNGSGEVEGRGREARP